MIRRAAWKIGPGRPAVAGAAMSVRLVGTGEVETDDAADHERDARQLEGVDALAEHRHADHSDRRGADPRPDGVGEADLQLSQSQRREPEGQRERREDEHGRKRPGEAIGFPEKDRSEHLARDRSRQIDPRQHDVYKCTTILYICTASEWVSP